jgi:beta-glucosidase
VKAHTLPVFLGKYPDDLSTLLGAPFPQVTPEDVAHIAAPIDFLGVNDYTRDVICHNPGNPFAQVGQVLPEGNDYSQTWEIYPRSRKAAGGTPG